VYLQAVTAAHHRFVSQVSTAITVFLLTSAVLQRPVGGRIGLYGPRPVLLAGSASLTIAVMAIGRVASALQLYPCFFLLGIGWATSRPRGFRPPCPPRFERHQGRSTTLAIMGASFGAIAGVLLLIFVIGRWGLSDGLLEIGAASAMVLLPFVWVVLRYHGPAELGREKDGGITGEDKAVGIAGSRIATPSNRRRLLWSSTMALSLVLLVQIGFIAHHVKLAELLLGTVGAGLLVSATGAIAFVGRLYLAKVVDSSPVRRLASEGIRRGGIRRRLRWRGNRNPSNFRLSRARSSGT
jgi:MFS family permease